MLCRLILLAATTFVCAGHVHAGVTSQGIARNSLTNQVGLAAHVDRRRPCDDDGSGIRTNCCDESQIGCRITKRGVTWIELSPIFGEPVRANTVRVGPRVNNVTIIDTWCDPIPAQESVSFGTLQLNGNDLIIIKSEPSAPSRDFPIQLSPGSYHFNVHDLYRFDQP